MLSLNNKKLILASSSPRRAQLLNLLGLAFEVRDSFFDEESESFSIPEVQVLDLAHKKASRVAENIRDGLVVGADTVVVIDDLILGKPKDKKDALHMLKQLSGRSHTVYTGFAIIEHPSGQAVSDYDKTEVFFRDLSDEEIEHYVDTESPMDKAGAYGIQDESAVFVDKIEGCFYNVVGFPLTKFYTTLKSFLTVK
ncbi:MAG: Maf family protein [bacterium]